jgi:hypothetical protein
VPGEPTGILVKRDPLPPSAALLHLLSTIQGARLSTTSSSCSSPKSKAVHNLLHLLSIKELDCPQPPPHALHQGARLFTSSSSCSPTRSQAVHNLLYLLSTKELGCPHPPLLALQQGIRLFTTSSSFSSGCSHPPLHALHQGASLFTPSSFCLLTLLQPVYVITFVYVVISSLEID